MAPTGDPVSPPLGELVEPPDGKLVLPEDWPFDDAEDAEAAAE